MEMFNWKMFLPRDYIVLERVAPRRANMRLIFEQALVFSVSWAVQILTLS